jgi:hypothetical protein
LEDIHDFEVDKSGTRICIKVLLREHQHSFYFKGSVEDVAKWSQYLKTPEQKTEAENLQALKEFEEKWILPYTGL